MAKGLEGFEGFVTASTQTVGAARGKAIDLVCSKLWYGKLAALSWAKSRELAGMAGLPWQATALPRKWEECGGADGLQGLQRGLNELAREMAADSGKAVGLELFAEFWKGLVDAPKRKTPEEKLRAAIEAYARSVGEGTACVDTGALAGCIDRLQGLQAVAEPMPGTPCEAPSPAPVN